MIRHPFIQPALLTFELTSQGLPGGKIPDVKCMLIEVGDLFSPETALILKKDFLTPKAIYDCKKWEI